MAMSFRITKGSYSRRVSCNSFRDLADSSKRLPKALLGGATYERSIGRNFEGFDYAAR